MKTKIAGLFFNPCWIFQRVCLLRYKHRQCVRRWCANAGFGTKLVLFVTIHVEALMFRKGEPQRHVLIINSRNAIVMWCDPGSRHIRLEFHWFTPKPRIQEHAHPLYILCFEGVLLECLESTYEEYKYSFTQYDVRKVSSEPLVVERLVAFQVTAMSHMFFPIVMTSDTQPK